METLLHGRCTNKSNMKFFITLNETNYPSAYLTYTLHPINVMPQSISLYALYI